MMVRRSRKDTVPSGDDEGSDYLDKPTRKRAKHARSVSTHVDTSGTSRMIRHPKALHTIRDAVGARKALLRWFAGAHDARRMPWRRRFNPNLTSDEMAQRAYEVWVSEVMLQQTQVTTVIPYYNRWMEKFPTLDSLARSNIEEVNALWKGLGYYSRASRLLAGAQKVMKTMDGRLPDNAKDLQDKVPGIGRYSAGAICSIAYGERVPVLDGNVHRLLSRFLAIHAPPKTKATLDLLWSAATSFVEVEDTPSRSPEPNEDIAQMSRTQYAGDINQALIELGSTVCKVRDPQCVICPLSTWCRAFALSHDPIDENKAIIDVPDIEDICSLCEPVHDGCAVTTFPMKANRKTRREELDIVYVIEWHLSLAPEDRWFLLVRRPENGLLAGLYEFPTTVNVSKYTSRTALPKQTNEWLSKAFKSVIPPWGRSDEQNSGVSERNTYYVKDITSIGDVDHVFSHVKKTYCVQWVVLEGSQGPPELATEKTITQGAPDSATSVTKSSMWCSLNEVRKANIGSGVVKIWDLVKTKWERSGS